MEPDIGDGTDNARIHELHWTSRNAMCKRWDTPGRIVSGHSVIQRRAAICYEVCWSAVAVVGAWWAPGRNREDAIFAPFAIPAMRPAPVTGGV